MYSEIEMRTQKANRVTYQLAPLLSHKNIPMEVKAQLVTTIFLPTLTYQCQTWSLNVEKEWKITTCEMKCLRKTINVTRRDRIMNDIIRQQIGTKPVIDFIKQHRIKWFGHLMRMPNSKPALRAYLKRESGYKSRGRPRKTWLHGVKEVMKQHSLTTTDVTHLAQKRKLLLPSTSWRR